MAEYVSLADQRRMHITLPPLDEQRAIAHILGTLDDKIELNRRMSETLEAMARALFKSWFVDFLPVRAKMAAKERDPSLLLPQAEPNTWYVYAIECNDGSLYIGQTEDLRQRWLQHVGGKGASWTKQHPPVQVPYWEKQPSREAAVERENWLKTGYGRKWLKHEIAARTQTGDPVRAKCRGGVTPPLRWPQHILDLFPDSFEDSELGGIPRGWEVGTLGDVAEHPRRGVQPRIIKPDTPYIALEHMPKRCIALSDWGVADGLGSNKFEFRKGEILFGKLRPYFHKVGVAPVDGVCSTDIVVVAPRLPHWFAFLLGVVSSDEFVEYTNAGSTGTKMPRTSWAEMARYDIALPPQAVAQAFTEIVRPVVDRIISAIHGSRTLAALRDALLPKLISGELRVKDAERFLKKRGL
jgi:type I restriction enzyme S subunit